MTFAQQDDIGIRQKIDALRAEHRWHPDGYTLLMSSGGMVSVNPSIYPKMSFDPAKDLVPVAAAARVLVFLVIKPDFPARDAREFIAVMKAKPGKLSFGSSGNGSSPHLATEMMKSQAGVFATHVPYRGAAPALTDLLAGQIDFLFGPGVARPHIKPGRLPLRPSRTSWAASFR